MLRFLSIALLANWLAIITAIALAGFGLDGENGLLASVAAMFSGEGLFAFDVVTARAIALSIALTVLVAGLWAALSLAFSEADENGRSDAEFAVAGAFGLCLAVFATLLLLAAFERNHMVGALTSVASFATVLTAVAWRWLINDAAIKASAPLESISMATARRMANRSARVSELRARTALVPKE